MIEYFCDLPSLIVLWHYEMHLQIYTNTNWAAVVVCEIKTNEPIFQQHSCFGNHRCSFVLNQDRFNRLNYLKPMDWIFKFNLASTKKKCTKKKFNLATTTSTKKLLTVINNTYVIALNLRLILALFNILVWFLTTIQFKGEDFRLSLWLDLPSTRFYCQGFYFFILFLGLHKCQLNLICS